MLTRPVKVNMQRHCGDLWQLDSEQHFFWLYRRLVMALEAITLTHLFLGIYNHSEMKKQ